MPRRVLIMGAAGRDFHNFNVAYRGDRRFEVVAFTATQIPFIDDRIYPASLAGERYPNGIEIHEEDELTRLIHDLKVDDVVFSYSDVGHEYVMHKASQVLAAGANFVLLGPNETMLEASVPVVSVCAVRTGSGKSQTTRAIAQTLKDADKRIVAVRHPMPYGNLEAQRVQRYGTLEDLERYDTTIEEREEYEPHITTGTVIYAGVDYGDVLEQAQAECDVLIWDGGNNDLPFYRPDVHIVVADPHRPGHETRYHPGETNLRMADVVVINKVDTAEPANVEAVAATVAEINPGAVVIRADSPVTVDDPAAIEGKRVLVIEDGPTLSHGEMTYGAGVVAAKQHGAAEIVDPREWAAGSLGEVYEKYPVGPVLPAMGYSDEQIAELERTIDETPCDLVVVATPVDLARIASFSKPSLRVGYELRERDGEPTIAGILEERLPDGG